MNRIIILITLIATINFSKAQTKILFDAMKAEMASNLDWVIDADSHNLKANSSGTVTTGGSDSNPQKTPTPSQSGITADLLDRLIECLGSRYGKKGIYCRNDSLLRENH